MIGNMDFPQIPYQNPCRRGDVHAPLAVCGGYPDGSGGGVLFWAYDVHEAEYVRNWCVENGYLHVSVQPTEDD